MGALQSDLPKVSPSSLESVFGQCMYFGLSFGRIGSDFRSLLVPLFSQVVYDRFDHSTNKSELQFAEAMASFSLVRPSIGSHINSSLIPTPPSSADQVQPPYSLMKFSPLAELCNGLIAAFNELRMCAPVQLVEPVSAKLERTLSNCSQIMADFHRQEKEAFTVHEEQEYVKCLQLYRNEFVPFVQRIIHLMFPPALISAQTGFPTGEIVKQELGSINKDFILKPVAHLLLKEEVILPPLPDLDLPAKTEQLVEETKVADFTIQELSQTVEDTEHQEIDQENNSNDVVEDAKSSAVNQDSVPTLDVVDNQQNAPPESNLVTLDSGNLIEQVTEPEIQADTEIDPKEESAEDTLEQLSSTEKQEDLPS